MGCQQVDGFTESVNHLRKLRSEVLSRMKEEGIDLLLGPVMPFPSIEESVAHLFSCEFSIMDTLAKYPMCT